MGMMCVSIDMFEKVGHSEHQCDCNLTIEVFLYTPDFDLAIFVLTRWTSKCTCDAATDPLTHMCLKK